jgi:DNA gyrase subunit B
MDRTHRLLRRVRLDDAERAADVFEMLMGNDVAPRKEFIISGGDQLDRERIDA